MVVSSVSVLLLKFHTRGGVVGCARDFRRHAGDLAEKDRLEL